MFDRRFRTTAALTSIAIVSLAAVAAADVGQGRSTKEPSPVAARLVAERTAFAPGDTTLLGIAFTIEKGWHLFWDGRNDTGAPIAARPTLPDGFRAGDLLWPAPKRLVSPGKILDHVYEGDLLLLLPVVVPAGAASGGGNATVTCALDWVACREACVLGDATVSLTLPVAPAEEAPALSESAPLFRSARERLARPLPTDQRAVEWEWAGDALRIRATRQTPLAFYPGSECGELVDPITDCVSAKGELALRFRSANGRIGPAQGLLLLSPENASQSEIYEVDIFHPTDKEVRR